MPATSFSMNFDPGRLVSGAVLAVLVFWIVGAYNRLVRLRAELVRQFAPLHARFDIRQGLLHEQLELLDPVLASAAGPRLQALRDACQRAEAACAVAKGRPAAPGAIAGLRAAEDVLAEARGRLPAQGAAGLDLAELHNQLRAVDVTLTFARDQFNASVEAYNQAAAQFPTLLVAGLFRLHPAATL